MDGKLRISARDLIQGIDAEHRDAFSRVIHAILSTEIYPFAQILSMEPPRPMCPGINIMGRSISTIRSERMPRFALMCWIGQGSIFDFA
jgi:hypothetical protein